YNTLMEKHKIFISGLPFSCTKEQLEEICKNHGTIKDVRLVTYRSGKPKERERTHSAFFTPPISAPSIGTSGQSGERDHSRASTATAINGQHSSECGRRAEVFVKFRLCKDASQ
ncbi:hypothetical protein GOODEAATRI_017173, partial [Goodea atripinnis]